MQHWTRTRTRLNPFEPVPVQNAFKRRSLPVRYPFARRKNVAFWGPKKYENHVSKQGLKNPFFGVKIEIMLVHVGSCWFMLTPVLDLEISSGCQTGSHGNLWTIWASVTARVQKSELQWCSCFKDLNSLNKEKPSCAEKAIFVTGIDRSGFRSNRSQWCCAPKKCRKGCLTARAGQFPFVATSGHVVSWRRELKCVPALLA